MSLHLIPKLKGNGGRRAVDKLDELRAENRKLLTRQMAADDFFALLTQDRNDVYAAWNDAEEKAAQMCMERDEAIEGRDALAGEVAWLRKKFGAQLAADANATRITVPPMVRDTTAIEDQATGPIYVRELQDRYKDGPVVTLHHSPQAANPAHVPAPVT